MAHRNVPDLAGCTDRRRGQALAEYAMILLFIAVACVVAATLLGTTVQGLYNGFNGSF